MCCPYPILSQPFWNSDIFLDRIKPVVVVGEPHFGHIEDAFCRPFADIDSCVDSAEKPLDPAGGFSSESIGEGGKEIGLGILERGRGVFVSPGSTLFDQRLDIFCLLRYQGVDLLFVLNSEAERADIVDSSHDREPFGAFAL